MWSSGRNKFPSGGERFKLRHLLIISAVGALVLGTVIERGTDGHPSDAPHWITGGISSAAQPARSDPVCVTYTTRKLHSEYDIAAAISDHLPPGNFETANDVVFTIQTTARNLPSGSNELLARGTAIYISDAALCRGAIKAGLKTDSFTAAPTPTP